MTKGRTVQINVLKLKWNLYQVQLYGEDGAPVFSETAELLTEKKRMALAAKLRKRFPELGEKDLEARLLERMEAADAAHAARGGQAEPQSDQLMRLAEGSGNLFFRDDVGDAYAQVLQDGHREVWRCRGRDFRRWLIQAFLREHGGKTPYREAVSAALEALESKVSFASPEYVLYNRAARCGHDFYYDLGDSQWRVVKITAQGWEIKGDTPAPLFRRRLHQKPQVLPLPGGDPFQLLSFVNVQDEMAQLLLVVYAISCLVPDIPHPIPIVHGPGGAAKTTFSRVLRLLIDPSSLPALTFPWEERELVQKLSHHWFAPFDNVSTLPDWTQDTLCRACTGEGFSKRELYSDDEDVIYSFRRCILLNGINIAATHADLLRRAILFPLEEIPPDKRRPERKLLAEFEMARPYILGGMFDALSRAMALHPSIRLRELPSMADFAEWGAAISQALGRSQEAFLQAYSANIQSQHVAAIESSPVALTLLKFMEDRTKWEGAPSQLYSELLAMAEALNISIKDRQWPKNPNWLMRAINKVKPNLRANGLVLSQQANGSRLLTIAQEKDAGQSGFSQEEENVAAAAVSPQQIAFGGHPDKAIKHGDIAKNVALSEGEGLQIVNGDNGDKSDISPPCTKDEAPEQVNAGLSQEEENVAAVAVSPQQIAFEGRPDEAIKHGDIAKNVALSDGAGHQIESGDNGDKSDISPLCTKDEAPEQANAGAGGEERDLPKGSRKGKEGEWKLVL